MLTPILESQKLLAKYQETLNKYTQFVAYAEKFDLYRQGQSVTILIGKEINNIIPFLFHFNNKEMKYGHYENHFIMPTEDSNWLFLDQMYYHTPGTDNHYGMTYLFFPEANMHPIDIELFAEEVMKLKRKEALKQPSVCPVIILTHSIDLLDAFDLSICKYKENNPNETKEIVRVIRITMEPSDPQKMNFVEFNENKLRISMKNDIEIR